MADYSSAGFNTLYGTVLGLSSGNITGSLKAVQDGNGNSTALQVSTAGIKSTGTLISTGAATIGGACGATSYTGDASAMTNVYAAVIASRTLTADGTISDDDQLLIMNGNSLNLTVNTAADVGGRVYKIMNKHSSPVTIVTGGETIIGLGSTSASNRTLGAYTSITITAANNEFYIVT